MTDDSSLGMRMYSLLFMARKFDEAQIAFYKSGREPMESVHSYIGQEAIGVGAGLAMEKGDILLPSLRSRPAFFALGVPVLTQWAGVMSRADSPGQGLIGSRHMTALEYGIAGTTGIVAAQIPTATGVAMALQAQGQSRAAVCLFGDGAANRGDCHEGMNMAAVYKSPVVFICESNGVAESQHWESYMPIDDLSVRAQAYGMPGACIDGNDVEAVHRAVSEALDYARAGKGPSFIVAQTCRIRAHVEGLPDFRTKEYLEEWKQRDPVQLQRERLLSSGHCTESDLEKIEHDIEAEIDASLEAAIVLPIRDVSTLGSAVYISDEV